MKQSINKKLFEVKEVEIDFVKVLKQSALAGLVLGVCIFDLYQISKLSQVVSLELRSPFQNPFVLKQKQSTTQVIYINREVIKESPAKSADLFDKYFGKEANLMRAICTAESGLKNIPSKNINSNGTQDHGICQINDIHISKAGSIENLYNPEINIKVAKQIRDTQGLNAWSAYKNGSYRKHL